MANEHLNPALIAQIVDQGHDALAPEQLRHLSGCRRCLEAFRDVALILGLEHDDQAVRTSAETGTHPDRIPRPFWRRPAWALGAGGALVALVAVAWTLSLRSPIEPGLSDAVLALLDEQSMSGFVVSDSATRPSPPSATHRSGGTSPASFEELSNDDLRPNRTTLLALLASGHADEARALIPALQPFQRGEPWARHLDALAAYRTNRIDEAERILRGILAEDKGDDVARFNLALLLDETGRREEARRLLDQVDSRRGSILAHRAEDLARTLN